MGSSGSGSSQQVTNLFVGFEPEVSEYLKAMRDLVNYSTTTTKPQFRPPLFTIPAQTYALQDANELEGISRLATRSRDGSPIISAGETVLRNTFDGLNLTNNPKLDALWTRRKEEVIQEWEEEILPRIHSIANLNGGFGSSGHHVMQAKEAEKVMKRLVQIAYEIYGQNYFAERAIQQAALGLGIEYGTQDIKDAEMLRQVGLYKREYSQGAREDAYKRSMAEIDMEITRLEVLGNAIRTVMGSYVTRTEQLFYPSKFGEIAGIALAGMSLAGSIYGNGGFGSPSTGQAGSPSSGPTPSYSPGSAVPSYQVG
ncbi:hypothetical protein [Candidatus Manganitrophus noduliformans]|uniref:Uncharacterized protein n=1 Tax=Candidatus Manganitrophus noduliformans TaxID=2606439 RepID=A0A7X6I9X8_9BACT|nr:hypothetical protein [Candidatus Manganitrophus noduliformans]NKE69906.1 hypothetical protein [Candidatus Manganitrophus noduliformans]